MRVFTNSLWPTGTPPSPRMCWLTGWISSTLKDGYPGSRSWDTRPGVRFLLNSSSNTTRMPTRPHSSSPWKRCCLVWSRRGGLTWSTSTPFTPDSRSGTPGSTPHRYLTRLTSLLELHLSIAFLFLSCSSFLCFCCLLTNYLFCIVLCL
ncbi:hypothetical protein GBAR_LOCUS5297 [Geodia barretti]|uniref:Uncharacterized protein n=1 Tax=Geodia barretti TaxID=519541 RepID=A0AA35RC11_GEOBA|nr:hypothetical protein GBAR_LOCUS5297 [Geodia barretti]